MDIIKLFSIKGRLRRRDYIIAVIIGLAPMAIGYFLLKNLGIEISAYVIDAIRLICFIFIFIQSTKRLHDIGLSAWFALVGVVPFLNLVFLIWLCIQDGYSGTNSYGLDPKGRESEEEAEELDF